MRVLLVGCIDSLILLYQIFLALQNGFSQQSLAKWMEQEKPQSGFVQSPTLSVSVGEGQCGARAQGIDGFHDGLGDGEMFVDALCVSLGKEARDGLELVDHAVRVAVLAECLRRAALSDRDARQLVGRAVDAQPAVLALHGEEARTRAVLRTDSRGEEVLVAQRRDARGVDAVEAAVRRVMGRLRLAKQRDDQVEVIESAVKPCPLGLGI